MTCPKSFFSYFYIFTYFSVKITCLEETSLSTSLLRRECLEDVSKMSLNRIFQKQLYPPSVEDIDFLEVHLLDFQLNLPWPPRIFLFFALTPMEIHVWNPRFFLNFWCTPWNSNDFCSTLPPLEFFHWYPQKGGLQFFLEKLNTSFLNIMTYL